MSEEPKNCPFCGHATDVLVADDQNLISAEFDDPPLQVGCDCGVSGPYRATNEEAIAEWDRMAALQEGEVVAPKKAVQRGLNAIIEASRFGDGDRDAEQLGDALNGR